MSTKPPIGTCEEHGPYYAHFMEGSGSSGFPGCPVCAQKEYEEYSSKCDKEGRVLRNKRAWIVWPITLLGLITGYMVGGFLNTILGLLLGGIAAQLIAGAEWNTPIWLFAMTGAFIGGRTAGFTGFVIGVAVAVLLGIALLRVRRRWPLIGPTI